MVCDAVQKICKDIRSLKIQGARNVAIAAVRALAMQAQQSRAKNVRDFYAELLSAADMLCATRPTEPMMRNSLKKALRFVFFRMKKEGGSLSVEKLKRLMQEEEKNYTLNMETNALRIAKIGAKALPKNACVLTHCHSSTVMRILLRANEIGKIKYAGCTETRPLFQGRITARELSEAGIDTTITVDSAAKYAMEEFDIDAVLFGADAITSGGDLINKIGTSQIAQIASSAGIPVYSAAEIYKFDPATLWGGREGIEMRGREELLCGKEFKKVKAFNPAFDLTRAKFISAYITELGILPPQGISRALCKKFSIKNPI